MCAMDVLIEVWDVVWDECVPWMCGMNGCDECMGWIHGMGACMHVMDV